MDQFPDPDSEQWPQSEEELIELSRRLIQLMKENPEMWAGAPFSAEDMEAGLEELQTRSAEAAAADAEARAADAAAERSVVELQQMVKANGTTVTLSIDGHEERLGPLGWGGREGAGDWERPGVVREVSIAGQAGASVTLAWRPAQEDGPAESFTVQRHLPGREWEDAASVHGLRCTLWDQPRGVELDLRVVAAREEQTGDASEAVTVIL